MSVPKRASVYERLRPHLNAKDLIARLGLKEARVVGSEAYLRPLCHESTSGESLQVNLHTGRWNCKACQSAGVYGDLFQLVEYVLTGGAAPGRGAGGSDSPGRRSALEWLCGQFGVAYDVSGTVSGDPGLEVVHLFAMAAHRHLLDDAPHVLDWILEKWGFDRGTVEAYGLGFVPSPIMPSIAAESARPQSRGAFRSSGLGWYDADGRWRTRFEGRVTFPYLEHGRAVYLIGRATPWTPELDAGRRPPKYHKLSVHSEQRPYVSERVTNDHLYNEPVMDDVDEVGVVEGVADAVAFSALGVPVVSPVTISFNAVDLERFVRKCREAGIKRVWILFDNELSGSGNWAARRAGLKLVEHGLVARVLTLPIGTDQQRARDEVVAVLGDAIFDELERSEPRDRKRIVAESVPDEARRAWVVQNVEASKIDGAEWCASAGPAAPGRFDAIRKAGRDVVDLEIEDVAAELDLDLDPSERADEFLPAIAYAAHVDDRLAREGYAGRIAKAAGKGVTKAEILRRIAESRRDVKADRKEDSAPSVDTAEVARALVLLPPEGTHVQPASPPAPPVAVPTSGAPPAPPPPAKSEPTPHERYAPARDAVAKAVEAKWPEENLGEYVAQTVTRSMGYTPFRTPDELYLVRGNERVPVGLDRHTPRFATLLWLASGLTSKKATHRSYIAAAVYFLERDARRAQDVSWSFVGARGEVYFPTGDSIGRIVKVEPGKVTRTKMSEERVPAVAGDEFKPFEYVDRDGGIDSVLDAFRWTSLSSGDRLVLVYWIACLPILRRVGTVPIVRIEGGSSSGKTRTVDAVSFLVNGKKSSSVPTAAALISRMSTEMLTIDDNRETRDMTPAFLGTLLQATHLGAREKRKVNSDTGTVIERICGALLMNGIEPIHDGQSELASRMLTLRSSETFRAADSPRAEAALFRAILERRDAFWSDACRRCSLALEFDREHGERLGAEIEDLFGATKIGRLSTYLRLMVLAWTAGDPGQIEFAYELPEVWREAFDSITSGSLDSLLSEELAVSVLRYVFAYGAATAETLPGSDVRRAFDGKYQEDVRLGEAYLGPMRATQLARLARAAGKELNAPRAVASSLRAGQLERRVLDGLAFLREAGFEVDVETTGKGRHRFTFQRLSKAAVPSPQTSGFGGDTWVGP